MRVWIFKSWFIKSYKIAHYTICGEKPAHHKGTLTKRVMDEIPECLRPHKINKDGEYDFWETDEIIALLMQPKFEKYFPGVKLRVNQCVQAEMELK